MSVYVAVRVALARAGRSRSYVFCTSDGVVAVPEAAEALSAAEVAYALGRAERLGGVRYEVRQAASAIRVVVVDAGP